MLLRSVVQLAALAGVEAAAVNVRQATVTVTASSSSSSVPQYFQTTPELFAGMH